MLAATFVAPATMARAQRTGRCHALEERRLNHGLQTTLSGRSAFPVARTSVFHSSINQKLPELWSDFSERGLADARTGFDDKAARFHGDLHNSSPTASVTLSPMQSQLGGGTASSFPTTARHVVFAGFAEFDMDGRHHTAGEMDRLMLHAAASKYPCARPATLDEYVDKQISGLPKRNSSGRDVVFAGPGATGCELFHTNTLGAQKCIVSPGDPFDGSWGAASLYGRKCVLCVYPVERVKRQQSLTQFGLTRGSIGKEGRLKKAASLTALPRDTTRWTTTDFAGSTHHAARAMRGDQFFR